MAHVGKWKAAYYCTTKRAWMYGNFEVSPCYVRFYEDEKEDDIIDFRVHFDEFVEVKKQSTAIFYSALTIRTADTTYWFSSFPSCTNVQNILEHFWKERLFSSGSPGKDPSHDSRGQTFLRILHDSADCLSSTSKTIEKQGQQIDGACRTMNKLHNDLGVAEAIISSMDSWMEQWNVQTPLSDVVINVPNETEDFEKTEIPILYGPSEKAKHLSGSLVLSNKSVEVLDIQRNSLYNFSAKGISEGTVHTPFEMTLVKSTIGEPLVCVHLISAKLVQIIPHIELLLGPKLTFEEPPVNVVSNSDNDNQDELLKNLKLDEIDKQRQINSAKSKGGSTKTVSEAEAAQMAKLLQDMKSMAVGIKHEQSRQLNQLDYLSDSVDKANERLRKDTRTINHLT